MQVIFCKFPKFIFRHDHNRFGCDRNICSRVSPYASFRGHHILVIIMTKALQIVFDSIVRGENVFPMNNKLGLVPLQPLGHDLVLGTIMPKPQSIFGLNHPQVHLHLKLWKLLQGGRHRIRVILRPPVGPPHVAPVCDKPSQRQGRLEEGGECQGAQVAVGKTEQGRVGGQGQQPAATREGDHVLTFFLGVLTSPRKDCSQ
mmetsp:Transcript_5444/g.7356  ORF Transcript_5444/g.7356 Transcript_5444/m.7356 type:complete len:201 (-) Transcript_5444:661-1263(-)